MDKELSDFLTEIHIKVFIKTESLQVMVNIIGLLAVFSKGISKTAWEMAKGYGKKVQEEAISMRESGWVIKRKDMECLCGLMEMFIKVTTLMI
jgi:hypothetical protein